MLSYQPKEVNGDDNGKTFQTIETCGTKQQQQQSQAVCFALC